MVDYKEHLTVTTDVVAAFAGGPQNRYQFGGILRRLNVSHVLFRDTTQRYFSRGVLGLGDRSKVVEYLRGFTSSGRRVTCVGVSSGSYAALMYGQLAMTHATIAISPLTGRSERTAQDFGPEWRNQIVDPANADLDLLEFFQDGPANYCRAFVSDGAGCEIDRQMAKRIGIPDVMITMVPGFSHGNLARGMRDLGMFWEIFL